MPRALLAALFLALLASSSRADDPAPNAKGEPAPLAFEVTYPESLHPDGPISARVYVMLGRPGAPKPPRAGPDWMKPQPFFAVEAKDWKPGEPLVIDGRAEGFPKSLDQLEPGRYVAQAVVRLNPDTHALGDGEGNAYGPTVNADLDPATSGRVRLTVDTIVPVRKLPKSERLALVDIPSPILSAFYHRPIRHRAAVILPEGDPGKKRPTLYLVPGFGGDHTMAPRFLRDPRLAYAEDFLRVVLDPDCYTGHHVFADGPTNGPRGRALVEELIPHIERTFPAIAEPRARLLNGHSSGGWSTLWLQVTHPETFGGTWSTSPDPVDFRDFSGIDIYANDANAYRDPAGNRRPIARMGGAPVLYVDGFSRMEQVLGPGGQLGSFEAVFSPLGPDGRPRLLYDRRDGAIDPETAAAWRAYDVRLVLERDWATLGPKLKGKLHVITGAVDTFYLEGAVAKLKTTLEALGSDAVVEVVPGRDHFTLLDSDMARRLDREMHEAVARD